MKRLLLAVSWLTAFAVTVSLLVSTKPAEAQSAWPPAAMHVGDDPYTAGVFTSNGRTYTITFVDVVGTAADPDDHTINPGVAIASVSGLWHVDPSYDYPFSITPVYDASAYSSAHWNGTDKGSQSKLWRIASLEYRLTYGPYMYSARFSGMGDPVFRYRITCSNPPSNEFGVNVRIAQGVTAVSESMPMLYQPASGSSRGTYAGGNVLEATVSNWQQSRSAVRGQDFVEPAMLRNGKGFFCANEPLAINASANSHSGGNHNDMFSQSVTEIIPIEVIGP